jgi:membrane protein DedA with SNARE-associated domain
VAAFLGFSFPPGAFMGITELIANYVTTFMNQTGYITVFVAMVLESMVFPIPSEAVMPFAGFLIAEGKFSWTGVIAISTVASITGSLSSYALGLWGGTAVIKRFGRFLLIDEEELAFTQRFFKKYGGVTVFISRFIPVVRHLISIPAGLGRMNIASFVILTAVGAGLWNTFLAVCGFYLRQNWNSIMKYSHLVDIIVVALLAGLVVLYVARHLRKLHKRAKASS